MRPHTIPRAPSIVAGPIVPPPTRALDTPMAARDNPGTRTGYRSRFRG
jgi:hypothetical protein